MKPPHQLTASVVVRLVVYLRITMALVTANGGKEDATGSDGYTDENRPYELAFAIAGYQHRSEQKDDKGIITGEFGFVTGDGIYHETVYATDQSGRFRIITTKNYYVGLPGEVTAPNTPWTVSAARTTSRNLQSSGVQGCGGCRIPTTETETTRPVTHHELSGVERPLQNSPGLGGMKNFPTTSDLSPDLYSTLGPEYPADMTPEKPPGTDKLFPSTSKPAPLYTPVSRAGKDDTDMRRREKQQRKTDGDDDSGPLYEFNQTQTFQGHHEKGYADNNKEGDYFIRRRNGIGETVRYIADDSGYRPHIRFVNLTAFETPDPETEKIRNRLEGVYFKWFYGKG